MCQSLQILIHNILQKIYFNGFAPLQKPLPSIGFKGINSSGVRKKESLKN